MGNRSGWRAPAVQELASLLDGDPANTSSPRLPPGHPFVNVLVNASYLSATPQTDSPTTGAWAVSFSNGTVSDGAGKQNPRPIWCVRGGQGLLPPSRWMNNIFHYGQVALLGLAGFRFSRRK